jgi:hypothetical protein
MIFKDPVKIIFLDIDGVLNSWNVLLKRKYLDNSKEKGYDLYYENGIVLKYILTEIPEVKIVLSSCWRYSENNIIKIKEFFKNELYIDPNIIIDKTPRIVRDDDYIKINGKDYTTVYRGEEIQAWITKFLNEGNFIDKFVILDDDSDMLHLKDHLVQTHSDYGLTWVQAEEIIERLK